MGPVSNQKIDKIMYTYGGTTLPTRCNLCGEEFDLFDQQEGYSIHKKVGYGSTHDGEEIKLDLCCKCFDKIVDACAVSPVVGEWWPND